MRPALLSSLLLLAFASPFRAVHAAGDAPEAWNEPALEPGEGSIWDHIEALDGQPPNTQILTATEELAEERGAELTFLNAEGDSTLLDALAWYRDPLALLTADPLFLDRVDPKEFDLPVTVNEDVARWMRYFLGRGLKYYSRWLGRSTRYRDMIVPRLEARKMPRDLFYLSMIESGFSPNAYSTASAVGLWQFITATGTAYDLRVDWWVDERRDPERATEAALEHLQDLYDTFGDWWLAAAAYNSGAGRVRKAVNQAGTKDYWALCQAHALPEETRNYVPKIIAAAIIGHHPERYGLDKIEYQAPLVYEKADVPGGSSIESMAKCAGLSQDAFAELNPALRRWAAPPEPTTYNVRIPQGTGSGFSECMARVPPAERVAFQRHKVRKGESLGSVARKYGVSVDAVARMNGITNVNRIYVGMELVIPVPTKGAAASLATHEPTPSPSTSRPRTVTRTVTHTVRRGETLAAIADKYDVTVENLKAWNKITNANSIKAGQKLTVKKEEAVTSSSTSTKTTSSKTTASSTTSTATTTHKVRRGESLSVIAEKYGVAVEDLQKWNGIKDPKDLKAGQVLKIQGSGGGEKSSTARTSGDSWASYTVASGDTLGSIAKKYGCSVEDLKSWNSLTSSTIFPGQTLRVKK